MSAENSPPTLGLKPGTRGNNKLTVTAVKAAKPKNQPYRMADGRGLTLLVQPTGSKLWRFRYRFSGIEKNLSMGLWPDVGLKDARSRRDDARKLLAADPPIDPSVQRQAQKTTSANTFGLVAAEYFKGHSPTIAETTRVRDQRILDKLTARLSNRPLDAIEPPEILAVLRLTEKQGKHETAHRMLGMVNRVYSYALASGRATRNPSAGLRGALVPVVSKSRAALTNPAKVGKLLQDIDAYHGEPATVAGLKLLALTFLLPGELRQAMWGEFSLENSQWVVPAIRMKLRKEHIVPLSDQAVAILRELYNFTGHQELVFPSVRLGRPLSENTFSIALKIMGYDGDTHTAHGFRTMASTLLHELGFASELIETQLAHARPGVAGVYNRSHLLPQRRTMMAGWADYLDTLRSDVREVISMI